MIAHFGIEEVRERDRRYALIEHNWRREYLIRGDYTQIETYSVVYSLKCILEQESSD